MRMRKAAKSASPRVALPLAAGLYQQLVGSAKPRGPPGGPPPGGGSTYRCASSCCSTASAREQSARSCSWASGPAFRSTSAPNTSAQMSAESHWKHGKHGLQARAVLTEKCELILVIQVCMAVDKVLARSICNHSKHTLTQTFQGRLH